MLGPHDARRIIWVDPAVAGVARVAVSELRAKLGKMAWSVWRALCYMRDHYGVVHVTNRGLTKRTGLSIDGVKKGMKRLALAGLVRGIGWRERKVKRRDAVVTKRVYVRDVFGAIMVDKLPRTETYSEIKRFWDSFEPSEAVVPSTTESWMASANTWGGARRGAGQKRHPPAMNVSRVPTLGGSRVPPEVRVKNTRYIQSDSSKKNGADEAGASVLSPSSARDTGNVMSSSSFEKKIGLVIGDVKKAARVETISTPLVGVPPYPGISMIKPAQIPPPPKLADDASPLERCETIAAAWRGAIKARTGADSFAFRKGDILQSKWTKFLLSSAQALIDHEIPPTSWALFSLDIWRENNTKPIPPVKWAFAPRRIEERRGWFRRCAHSYAGGRVIIGPAFRDLIDRYTAMRLTLRQPEGATVEEIVDRFFPFEHSFEHCVAASREEADRYRWHHKQQIARGVFLWG